MTIGIGVYNPVPFQIGGGDSFLELEHQALLQALEPAFDPSEDTEHYWESYGEALASFMIWRINERLVSQGQPLTMIENLPVWEKSCALRPAPEDPDQDRRAALNGKLRGLSNNSLSDIEQSSKYILGNNFEALLVVDPVNWITYWPGVNPGPPGFEWTSNRARVCIHMNNINLTHKQFLSLRASLVFQLEAMCPAWMSFVIGVGTAFVCSIGIVGETLL